MKDVYKSRLHIRNIDITTLNHIHWIHIELKCVGHVRIEQIEGWEESSTFQIILRIKIYTNLPG